jgi:hypothetical protein
MSDFAIELNKRLSKTANGIAESIMEKLSESTGIPLKLGKPSDPTDRKPEVPASTRDNTPRNPFADQIVEESAASKLQKLARAANSDSNDPIEVMRALSSKKESELRQQSGNPKASDADVVAAFVLDRTFKLDADKKLASVIGRNPDMNNTSDLVRAVRQVKEIAQKEIGAIPNNDSDFLKRISHKLAAEQFQKAGVPAPSYEQTKK